jgi:hypothetical protein
MLSGMKLECIHIGSDYINVSAIGYITTKANSDLVVHVAGKDFKLSATGATKLMDMLTVILEDPGPPSSPGGFRKEGIPGI